MSIKVKTIQSTDAPAWDAYVHSHPQATPYHLSGWKNVIEKTYAHKTYYLMATKDNAQRSTRNARHTDFLPQACPVKPESCFTGAQRSSNKVVLEPSAGSQAQEPRTQHPEPSNQINPINPSNPRKPIFP